MKTSVIVPTYRRPQDLVRCLDALKQQTHPADEVIVVIRDSDTDTWERLKDYNCDPIPLRTLTVKVPGVVAAMNLGLEAAQGDIISFIDDDATAHPDWLERIEAHFLADDHLGGLGGRDWVYIGDQLQTGSQTVVGKVQWFGRVIGNHHIGTGEARPVDILKGVNMSFRRTAIKNLCFDQRMKGGGAQVHFEMMFCLKLKQAGWKLLYDPLVAVNHYPAQRFDQDQRDKFKTQTMIDRVHNETLSLVESLSPTRRLIFILWAILVGLGTAPGFLQFVRLLPKDGFLAGQKLLASLYGRWQGWQTWENTKQLKGYDIYGQKPTNK